MENASKALIIAGAILLAILIIGLGMMVFNNVRERAGDTSAIDEMSVQQYNSPYEAYLGKNVSAANVKALLDKIHTHNVAVENTDSALLIKVTLRTAANTKFSDNYEEATGNYLINMKSEIKSGKTYIVRTASQTASSFAPGYNTKTGYIQHIVIQFTS